MGCLAYFLLMPFAMGIVFTLGGFIVQPRSQAPLFFSLGIACLVVSSALFLAINNANKRAEKRKAEEERKKKLDELTSREWQERKFAHREGLRKYECMDIHDAEENRKGIAAIRQVGIIMQQSVYQEKEKNWAIRGGIAEGIAGPVAGIVTAANTIQDNARIRAENAARREWGAQQNAFYQELANQAERESPEPMYLSKLMRKYEAILSWKPSTLFSLIELSETQIDVDTQTGAVTVSTAWKQTDKSICIDGALRAKLYTDSGECAGCAYLVFPKVGTVGFSGQLSGICVRPKPATNYTVKIEPVDLWELASKGNPTSRKTDNLTNDEHRKIVADSEAKYQAELG